MIAIRDAHTHFFSRVFFATLARQSAPDRLPGEVAAEAARRAGVELPPEDPALLQERWIEAMDRAGIESMVTFASVPEEADVVAEACRNSGGRLRGLVALNPASPGAQALVERALGPLGFQGVVLFPALHRFDLSDPGCRPVLAALERSRGLCVVHCGVLRIKLRDAFGLPSVCDARFASPLTVVRAAGEHPGVSFVLPHFGGGMFHEALLAGSWCENVFVDTSSSNDWMRAQPQRLTLREVFERALDVFGPRRILFGTDSSTFPRGYRSDLLDTQTATLTAIGASHEDQEAVLGGNLEGLLGFATAPSP